MPLYLAAFMALGLSCASAQKQGMPDLSQISQTCLPTATANLILYFGKNGFPNLIQKGPTPEERELRTVHMLMADTDANFDLGTRRDMAADGVRTYIESAGYACDVEFRGLGTKNFAADWLKDNADPNTGFILFFAYVAYHNNNHTYSLALNQGHAVTLVTYSPGTLLIHDPAHRSYQIGRKILSTQPAEKGAYFVGGGKVASVDGFMEVSGSFLDAPPEATVMLVGALRVQMLPNKKPGEGTMLAAKGAGPTVDSGSPTGTATKSKAAPTEKTWMAALYDFLFN